MFDLDRALTELFPPLDAARWRELAERSLRGESWESLTRRAPGEPPVSPLATADAWSPPEPAEWPGIAPWTRGRRSPAAPGGWDVHQRLAVRDGDPVADWLREEWDGGADVVELDLTRHPDPVAVVLGAVAAKGRRLEWRLPPGAPEPAGLPEGTVRVADPLSWWQVTGTLPLPAPQALDDVVARAAAAPAGALLLEISAVPTHEAGGGAVAELAALLAAGAAVWRAAAAQDLAPGDLAGRLRLRLAVGTRLFGEIAKLRAARRLWARLAAVCGVEGPAAAPRLLAETSRRLLTRRDPWVNILRGTVGCFAAAVGGADAVTVRPFDRLLRHGDAGARRLARNTSLVLREEAHLGMVRDPAGGSWHLESRTDALCAEAWALLREVERRGGWFAVLRDGWWQEWTAATAADEASRVAVRDLPVTGVSMYPLLEEDLPAGAPPLPLAPPAAGDADAIAPLPLRRPAAPFEALRDAADAAAAARGERPAATLVTLGPLARHQARLAFARNLLAAGGIAARVTALDGEDGESEAGTAAGAVAPVAVLCADDADLSAAGREAVGRLAAAGRWVVLAAPPGPDADAWREAGVAAFAHRGADAPSLLQEIHRRLEVTS